nr:hypothetical protein [Ardenticatenaceae bacterium]
MSKKHYFPLLLFALLLFACQAAENTHPAVVKTNPPNIILYVEDALLMQNVPGDPTAVFNQRTGRFVRQLPAGRLSANGQTYLAANPQQGHTLIEQYQPHQADPVISFKANDKADVSAISANGQWAVLTINSTSEFKNLAKPVTVIQLLDLETGELSEAIPLTGSFEVEGIDNLGHSVYLIEHLPEMGNGNHYRVRLFDARDYLLDPNPIRDKRFLDEVMAGYAWGTATDPQGRWLTTLYVNTLSDQAFIHALNLKDGWALCLALPSDVEHLDHLRYYALTLSPDGNVVLAVNPLLGTVTEINLDDPSQQKTTSFDPVITPLTDTFQENMPPEWLLSTAISPDSQTLFFAFDQQVWRYERQTKQVSGPFAADKSIAALAVSPSNTN